MAASFRYSRFDYCHAFAALMPRGLVWTDDLGTVQHKLRVGLCGVYERSDFAANDLLIDAFPANTLNLLPEWEASVGLPDPCAGPLPTVQARRDQVVARFAGIGGQSAAHFIEYTAALGFVVTITTFAPFRAGRSPVGTPLYGVDWAYAWAINAALNTITWFRAGRSAAGEPLASWSNLVLECELNAIAPAHKILLFQYS